MLLFMVFLIILICFFAKSFYTFFFYFSFGEFMSGYSPKKEVVTFLVLLVLLFLAVLLLFLRYRGSVAPVGVPSRVENFSMRRVVLNYSHDFDPSLSDLSFKRMNVNLSFGFAKLNRKSLWDLFSSGNVEYDVSGVPVRDKNIILNLSNDGEVVSAEFYYYSNRSYLVPFASSLGADVDYYFCGKNYSARSFFYIDNNNITLSGYELVYLPDNMTTTDVFITREGYDVVSPAVLRLFGCKVVKNE